MSVWHAAAPRRLETGCWQGLMPERWNSCITFLWVFKKRDTQLQTYLETVKLETCLVCVMRNNVLECSCTGEAGDHVPFFSLSPLVLLRQGFSQNLKLTPLDWSLSSRETLVMPFTLCRPCQGFRCAPLCLGSFVPLLALLNELFSNPKFGCKGWVNICGIYFSSHKRPIIPFQCILCPLNFDYLQLFSVLGFRFSKWHVIIYAFTLNYLSL